MAIVAKYNGKCKVTGMEIVAGETNLVKVKGVWQVEVDNSKAPIYASTSWPPSKDKHTFTHMGYTVYIYQIQSVYGHWRVYKVEDAQGNQVNLNYHGGLCLALRGENGAISRSNIASTPQSTEKHVKMLLEAWLENSLQGQENYELESYF